MMGVSVTQPPGSEGQKKEEGEIDREHIEEREPLHKVPHGERENQYLLNCGAGSCFPLPEELGKQHRENHEIGHETQEPSFRKIIEYHTMRPIEPGFGVLTWLEMAGIKMLIKYRGEIFRSPAEDRVFRESFPGRTPRPDAGGKTVHSLQARKHVALLRVDPSSYKKHRKNHYCGDFFGFFPEREN